jgi:hypothetical protein
MSKFIAERQISRLHVVGSNDITAPVIEDSYRRFLAIMDELIQQHPFTMGERPGSGDFALYAQLTQLARFDPTPAAICLDQAPRVHAWTDLVDDLSGWPATADGWTDIEAAAYLKELLTEVGRVYVPALLANAAAMDKGAKEMSTTIDGRPWTQPVFGYQAKCLWCDHNNQKSEQCGQDAKALRNLRCKRCADNRNNTSHKSCNWLACPCENRRSKPGRADSQNRYRKQYSECNCCLGPKEQ